MCIYSVCNNCHRAAEVLPEHASVEEKIVCQKYGLKLIAETVPDMHSK
jgi:hypothetical protein